MRYRNIPGVTQRPRLRVVLAKKTHLIMRPNQTKGTIIMSENTTAVVNKAAAKAGVAAAAVSENLPTVVETAELAMEIPVKVVLNQRLVVVASVVGGAALGAGVLFGVNKFRERRAEKKIVTAVDDAVAAS